MSAFSYTIMCNFAHNQLFLRMKKPLKRITIAGVSVLLLLLVAGSFFYDYLCFESQFEPS